MGSGQNSVRETNIEEKVISDATTEAIKYLSGELNEAVKAGDLTKAKELREELAKKMDTLMEKIDPYRVKHRKRLADKYELQYVGAFSPEGIAIVRKDNKCFYIDKKGKEIFG